MLPHLVRHGKPVIVPGKPAEYLATGRVQSASWCSSDEPKALATARALTDGEIEVEPALREAIRTDWFPRQDQFRAAVLDAFEDPSRGGHPGWEPLDQTRQRISAAVARIIHRSSADLVLVGHGTAWTLLVSEITGTPPDLRYLASAADAGPLHARSGKRIDCSGMGDLVIGGP